MVIFTLKKVTRFYVFGRFLDIPYKQKSGSKWPFLKVLKIIKKRVKNSDFREKHEKTGFFRVRSDRSKPLRTEKSSVRSCNHKFRPLFWRVRGSQNDPIFHFKRKGTFFVFFSCFFMQKRVKVHFTALKKVQKSTEK